VESLPAARVLLLVNYRPSTATPGAARPTTASKILSGARAASGPRSASSSSPAFSAGRGSILSWR